MVALCNVGYCNWSTITFAGDELKGTSAYLAYSMGNDTGCVILYSSKPATNHYPIIKLVAGEYSFFNWDTDSNFSYSYQKFNIATVGIYENGKLVKKGKMYLSVVDDKTDQAYICEPTESNKKWYRLKDQIKAIEIYDAVCKDGFSVRFIASRYDKSNFDVTITSDILFKSIDWIPENQNRRILEERRKAEESEKAKKKEIMKKKIKANLKQKESLAHQYDELKKREAICRKKGYNGALKNALTEMKKVKSKIDELDNETNALKSNLSE